MLARCGVISTFSMRQKRVLGQRFDREHVECRFRDLTGLQRRDQRGLVDHRATRGVDELGALRQ